MCVCFCMFNVHQNHFTNYKQTRLETFIIILIAVHFLIEVQIFAYTTTAEQQQCAYELNLIQFRLSFDHLLIQTHRETSILIKTTFCEEKLQTSCKRKRLFCVSRWFFVFDFRKCGQFSMDFLSKLSMAFKTNLSLRCWRCFSKIVNTRVVCLEIMDGQNEFAITKGTTQKILITYWLT